jgi:CheY-like chemotaxis protein
MTKKVLIVDDDQVIRLLLSDYLTSCGFEVETLESGIQCLESLSKGLPDVLLLDFQMPVMTGLEVLESIRKDENMKNLPVIMLSANKDTEKLVTNSGVTADLFIIKPCEMSAIHDAVKRVTQS